MEYGSSECYFTISYYYFNSYFSQHFQCMRYNLEMDKISVSPKNHYLFEWGQQ